MTDKRPFDVLNNSLNNSVVVGLKGGVEMRGVMSSYDVHMNIVLEKAEELRDGQVKRGIGTILLRGDSVIYIVPSS
ncbi:MAG: LSM domain-containing protein [Candidatus Micrarchaeia archaeon]